MRRRRSRAQGGETSATPRSGLDSMHGRLLLGLLVLALVPAAVGVVLAAAPLQDGGGTVAATHARQTSAAATALLVRAQAIETRLAALAADADVARVLSGPSGNTRQAGRRAMSSLRGRDGPIVAGACLTRVSDGSITVLAEDRGALEPSDSCVRGAALRAASRASSGSVVRSHASGSGQLVIATALAGRYSGLVLSAAIDIERLLEGTSATARHPGPSVVVETGDAAYVAGTDGLGPAGDDGPAPMAPSELGTYAEGILSGHAATTASLAGAGWESTVAELWPTSGRATLSLIQTWPLAPWGWSSALWTTVVVVATVALAGVLVLMRLLLKPFRELRESRSRLESMYKEARADALHDGLTGLGNHRAFQEELARQLERAERAGTPFSLMLVDLDNLKVVNDREGHAEGDHLLTGLARAMHEALRGADRVFRIGGDEFAVLLPATEPEQALEAASRLRHHCLRPPTGARPTPFSGGISAVPHFASDGRLLQRQADVALYWAKRHGRGFVELFDPERDKVAEGEGPVGLGNAVYEIARGHLFQPVYQPIVDLRTGSVLGFEGLIRPYPDGPIPDAERLFAAAAETGRTVELDLASFETVAAGAKRIGSDHIISINLSAKTLEVRDFDAAWLLNALVRHGISPSRVILELTERDPIVDVKRLQNNVRHLGEYGLRLAADDVGAGSAGLRMLAEIPFDIVKIDLSLVQSGAQHAASWAVLRSIRDLAWRQHSVVIGEGIENADQLRALQQLEIPVGQGYLLGRPQEEPDLRPRDLTNLVADPASGIVAPPLGADDVHGLPTLPELSVAHSGPRALPAPGPSPPGGQLQPV